MAYKVLATVKKIKTFR